MDDWKNFLAILLPIGLRKCLSQSVRKTLLSLSKVVSRLLWDPVIPETEPELLLQAVETLCCIQRDLPRDVRVMMLHLLPHLVRQRTEGSGPPRSFSMCGPERLHGWLKLLAFSRKSPVTAMAVRYSICQLAYLVEPVLEKAGLSTLPSKFERYSDPLVLQGNKRDVLLEDSEMLAVDKSNREAFSDFWGLNDEFESARKRITEERAGFRKQFLVAEEEYPQELRLENFPSSLLDWVQKQTRPLPNKLLDLVKGPSRYAEQYEQMMYQGSHYRSERLDSRNKVTQDSGVKVRIFVQAGGPALEPRFYYGVLQCILKIRVGDAEELFVKVKLYRKAMVDEDGLLLVRRDGFISSRWHSGIVRLKDLVGQVFYVDDPKEPAIRIVVETNQWRREPAEQPGDEEELGRGFERTSRSSLRVSDSRKVPKRATKQNPSEGAGALSASQAALSAVAFEQVKTGKQPAAEYKRIASKKDRPPGREGSSKDPPNLAGNPKPPPHIDLTDDMEEEQPPPTRAVVQRPAHVRAALQTHYPGRLLPGEHLPVELQRCLTWLETLAPETVVAERRNGGSRRSTARLDVSKGQLAAFYQPDQLLDVTVSWSTWKLYWGSLTHSQLGTLLFGSETTFSRTLLLI
jgi:hypothetical protein